MAEERTKTSFKEAMLLDPKIKFAFVSNWVAHNPYNATKEKGKMWVTLCEDLKAAVGVNIVKATYEKKMRNLINERIEAVKKQTEAKDTGNNDKEDVTEYERTLDEAVDQLRQSEEDKKRSTAERARKNAEQELLTTIGNQTLGIAMQRMPSGKNKKVWDDKVNEQKSNDDEDADLAFERDCGPPRKQAKKWRPKAPPLLSRPGAAPLVDVTNQEEDEPTELPDCDTADLDKSFAKYLDTKTETEAETRKIQWENLEMQKMKIERDSETEMARIRLAEKREQNAEMQTKLMMKMIEDYQQRRA